LKGCKLALRFGQPFFELAAGGFQVFQLLGQFADPLVQFILRFLGFAQGQFRARQHLTECVLRGGQGRKAHLPCLDLLLQPAARCVQFAQLCSLALDDLEPRRPIRFRFQVSPLEVFVTVVQIEQCPHQTGARRGLQPLNHLLPGVDCEGIPASHQVHVVGEQIGLELHITEARLAQQPGYGFAAEQKEVVGNHHRAQERRILLHELGVSLAFRKTWRLDQHDAARPQQFGAPPHRAGRVRHVFDDVHQCDDVEGFRLQSLLFDRPQ
jgi:hypothetical protein